MEFLSRDGLQYFWQQLIAKFVTHDESQKFVTKEDGKGLSSEDYTSEEKTKLASLSTTAEANQNAFGIVKTKSGSVNTTLNAAEEVSTLNFEAGDNITLSVNAATNTIKIIGADAPEAPEASLENLGISATATELNHVAGATSNIQTQLNNRFDIVGGGTSIAANTDLNTLTTPGNYSCVSGNVSSLTNCPITEGGFKLVVINGYTVEYKHQFLYWGAHSYIYYRTRNSNGTWKAWALLNNVSLANADGTLPISKGGTGATTAAEALTNLGAAPSGYGYGDKPEFLWFSDYTNESTLNTKLQEVFAAMSDQSAKQIQTAYKDGGTVLGTLYRLDANWGFFHAAGYNEKILHKVKSNGVWQNYLDCSPSAFAPASHTHDYVPTSRTVNGKALSSNITLSASDVSAVPTSRTINGKALSSNITLSASDVSARSNTWVPALADCSGTLSVAKGGTGATDITSARVSLKTACSYNIFDKPAGYDNVWYGWALTNYYASPTSANTWGDAYYMLVSSDGTLRVGTQLNDATSITWSKVYSENYKPTPDAIGAAPASHTHPEYFHIDSNGTAIAKNTNLNDLTTPGNYTCVSGNNSGLTNCPLSSGGFKLVTIRGYSENYFCQFIMAGASNKYYYRTRNSGGTWTAWVNFTDKTPAAHNHTTIQGVYTSNGGKQPPSYVGSGTVRFNMMNGFTGLSNSLAGTYADCILMDTYSGSDVPVVTALGILKTTSGSPRAFIATGAKGNTTTWYKEAELITTANVASSHTHGTLYGHTQSNRPSTVSPAIIGNNTFYHFLSTTSAKNDAAYPEDGHILHMEWDNTGGWNGQIFLRNTSNILKYRSMNNGVWNSWSTSHDTGTVLYGSSTPTASFTGQIWLKPV